MMSIKDVQKEVTAKIIERLKEGNLKPWSCPWVKTGENPMPYNYLTKDCYRGINVLLLWMISQEKGYSRNAWLTFRQAKQLGGNVKQGEKAVKCFFYKPINNEEESSDDEETSTTRAVLNYFNLFNIDQVEGIEVSDSQPYYTSEGEDLANDARCLFDDFSQQTNLSIARRGDVACYLPGLDRIDMPLGEFSCEDSYLATLFHECGHATGHRSRLDRFAKNDKLFKDIKKSYAFEELVAEQCAYLVGATYGFSGEHLQHESYIASWLKYLDDDYTFIFKAAAAASQAYEFILSTANEASESRILSA